LKRSKINQLLASFIGRVFYKKKGNQLRKNLRFIITIFYCIAILIFQMSQLASTLAVHNISAIFYLLLYELESIGYFLVTKNKVWVFAHLNVIGAIELFILIPIIYIIFYVWIIE
jgi:hypothetical protein